MIWKQFYNFYIKQNKLRFEKRICRENAIREFALTIQRYIINKKYITKELN